MITKCEINYEYKTKKNYGEEKHNDYAFYNPQQRNMLNKLLITKC